MKKSITVMQHHNPKFNSKEKETRENYPWSYRVIKATNTLEVTLEEWLTPNRVEQLIDQRITINIVLSGPTLPARSR